MKDFLSICQGDQMAFISFGLFMLITLIERVSILITVAVLKYILLVLMNVIPLQYC